MIRFTTGIGPYERTALDHHVRLAIGTLWEDWSTDTGPDDAAEDDAAEAECATEAD